jgi:DDE domain
MTKISYAGYRFPPEIIQRAVWLYYRFTLSFRDIEDLLAERGIIVSYETIRRWVNHFGPRVAADLRRRRPKPHATWHLDEVYLKINGRMVYLWRAVDAEGEVLDVLIQSRRNKAAALKLMRKLLKKYALSQTGWSPRICDPIAPQPTNLALQAATTAVDGATTGRRTRISRRGDENARCKGSRAPDRRKDFSPRTPPFRIPSTSNATSPQRERTGPSERRR